MGAVDFASSYDPPQSLADRLARRMYKRVYRNGLTDRNLEAGRQIDGASQIFRLRCIFRKLRLGALPIRIVFLASGPLSWCSVHSLYAACMADAAFKVSVINIGWGTWQGMSADCAALFERHGIPYFDGMSRAFPLQELHPDVLVIDSPYDQFRPAAYSVSALRRFGKILYVPYGADFADGSAGVVAQRTYGLDTQKSAWRIVSRTPRTAEQYLNVGGIPPRRIVGLGLPIFDLYGKVKLFDGLPDEVVTASRGKFKILYAPHHSIQGWSTFQRYGPHIRRLLQDNDDVYVVFRPHPGLGPTLQNANIMPLDEFRSFFPPDRAYLYEGDGYEDAFRWSDVLISDASSFLLLYAPARKPVIYLHREDGWGLDDTIHEDVFQGYYVAQSESDLTMYIDRLKQGEDPLADVRERCQRRMSVGMFEGGAGERIAGYLRDQLA